MVRPILATFQEALTEQKTNLQLLQLWTKVLCSSTWKKLPGAICVYSFWLVSASWIGRAFRSIGPGTGLVSGSYIRAAAGGF